MALMKSDEAPQDAIILDEVEAISYAWELVSNWDSLSDTWALKYASGILGGINAISGILINRHFRNKLKLGNYGFFSSLVPISLMPGVLTPLFHRHLVSSRMLLVKDEHCPLCYEIRSTALQLGLGVLYPMILAPTSAMMFANRHSTTRVPDLTEGPKVVFNFLRKITRPFNGSLAYIASFQIIASAVLTYYELRNNISLRTKVIELEKKLDDERNNMR